MNDLIFFLSVTTSRSNLHAGTIHWNVARYWMFIVQTSGFPWDVRVTSPEILSSDHIINISRDQYPLSNDPNSTDQRVETRRAGNCLYGYMRAIALGWCGSSARYHAGRGTCEVHVRESTLARSRVIGGFPPQPDGMDKLITFEDV